VACIAVQNQAVRLGTKGWNPDTKCQSGQKTAAAGRSEDPPSRVTIGVYRIKVNRDCADGPLPNGQRIEPLVGRALALTRM